VFEGNEPASVCDCEPLNSVISRGAWPKPAKSARTWLGEPIAILPSVTATFGRQAGRHLIVVERDEAVGLGVLMAAWVSLLVQHRPTTARFWALDLASADGPAAEYSSELRLPTLQLLTETIRERLEDQSGSDAPLYLLILGLHRARELRPGDDDFYSSKDEPSAAKLLTTILKDGPEAGVHVLTWCDTVANARRTLDRSFNEFGMRVAGPMSADDSQSFFDATDASRLDKPFRLIFADEDRPGVLQKFRPFALPELTWLRGIGQSQRDWLHD
jgi:DNA segregation ATPase FtsK/SpoIIIE, S-DNA-T family